MNSTFTTGLVLLCAGLASACGNSSSLATVPLAPPPVVVGESRCGAHPWCDTSLDPAERAELLLAAMTLQEKISLMAGDDPAGVFTGTPATGTSDGIERLDIPVLYLSDGPVGPREGQVTAMPSPMAVAATFNPEVAREVGRVIADEVKHKGNDLVHAPTVEPMRTPLAGRAFEGYGEDPLLAARLAVEMIDGVQQEGIVANVKHFAPNSQEGVQGVPPLTGTAGSRFLIDAIIDERTLREIYFPAFEAAVKEAGVGAVMCAYGSLNGHFACESEFLLKQVLRDEWGFDGMVIADYGFAMKSTAASANAGTDLEMPSGVWYSPVVLQLAVVTGQISEDTIDARVGAILRTMFRFGLFDRAAYIADDGAIDKPAHAAVAQHAAEQSMVLLQNRDAALPLDAATLQSVAVIGEQATTYKGGAGSANVEPFAFKSPLDAIRERAGPGIEIRHDPGTNAASATAVAAGASAAIVFVADAVSEGSDRPCLGIRCAAIDPVGGTPLGTAGRPDLDGLIEAVAAANPRTIVVMETGGPVLSPWADRVPVVIAAWYPGQEIGPAIAAVLFGDADPGGRLPVTFPINEADIPTAGNPAQYPGIGTRVEHSEGIFIGYRHYDLHDIEPRWPFGHGLSYTTFALSELSAAPSGSSVVIEGVVTNTGSRAGWAVPQLYVSLPSPGPTVPQAPVALKGFAKHWLTPGQSQRLSFTLAPRDLSYWDVGSSDWKVAPGCYVFILGQSSRDRALSVPVALAGGSCNGAAP